MTQSKKLDRVYEFTLSELCDVGGIDGMNDLAQAAYENEEGKFAGILSELEFYPRHIRGELIGVQVIAEIVPIRESEE